MVRKFFQYTGLALVVAATASVAQAQTSSSGTGVPEIDAGSMVSALTLLTGGVLMLSDKFRGR